MNGIIFTADSIAAIDAGTKTQTRRVIPVSRFQCVEDGMAWSENEYGDWYETKHHRVGEVLYVKEAWGQEDGDIRYRAAEKDHGIFRKGFWRSPLFMPEWAARRWVRIVAVRAERVQDITEADVDAEGFGGDVPARAFPSRWWSKDARDGGKSMPECFGELWDSINAKRHPWTSNPWVWVYTFERSKP